MTPRLLNVLAVAVFVFGTMFTVTCVALGIVFFSEATRNPTLETMPVLVGIGTFACIAILGGWMSARAWRHLRSPDARTTNDVISFALFPIATIGLAPLFEKRPAFFVVLVLGLFLLRNYLNKRATRQLAGAH